MGWMYITKENVIPADEWPRIYFACHPDDSGLFGRIRDILFSAIDCVIVHKEYIDAPLDEEAEFLIEQSNLFVIPITYKLLTEPNPAMDEDVPCALQKGVPVLPLKMEPGLADLYKTKFGRIHYLSPDSSDETAVSFETKLGRYLDGLLVGGELARRVRDEFDFTVFLSYRKKDRRYANSLMRTIHSIPECRDISIWYDEYLTPGEEYSTSLKNMLEKCRFVLLLVTPNLVNETNYVQTHEYPDAVKNGKLIVPVEMAATDRAQLARMYEGIDEPLPSADTDEFRKHFLGRISEILNRENHDDPEHIYLIGRAFLDGIDTEINREYGSALVEKAADAGSCEAMLTLSNMYLSGKFFEVDLQACLEWKQKAVDRMTELFGGSDENVILEMTELGGMYRESGDFDSAENCHEKALNESRILHGADSAMVIDLYRELAADRRMAGDPESALRMAESALQLSDSVFGEDSDVSQRILYTISEVETDLGNAEKSLEIQKKLYDLMLRTEGKTRLQLLKMNMAYNMSLSGDHESAMEIYTDIYNERRERYGEDHLHTLEVLSEMALTCQRMGRYAEALELQEKVLATYEKVFGQLSVQAAAALHNIGYSCIGIGDYPKAQERLTESYGIRAKRLGEDHPECLNTRRYIADCLFMTGRYNDGMQTIREVFLARVKLLGRDHPDTIGTLNSLIHIAKLADANGDYPIKYATYVNLLTICSEGLGCDNELTDGIYSRIYNDLHTDLEKMEAGTRVNIYQMLLDGAESVYGEDADTVIVLLMEMGLVLNDLGASDQARNVLEDACSRSVRKNGPESRNSIMGQINLAWICHCGGDDRSAYEHCRNAYEIMKNVLEEGDPLFATAENDLQTYQDALK
ncbi:MAG: toll/interleukin-1 receptor domain-containing protein [Lachnospiraceae bacterium]|nr:toll/interleukin-1 receptor domain-containing protein [Lachnospiraceae bacterium]